MTTLLGTSVGVFIGLTVILMGGAAYMTGQAIATTWRPRWQVIVYCALLALVSRFLIFALFEGRLLWLPGLIIDALILIAIGLFAYRITHVRKVLSQYPWQYQRQGLFGYRQRSAAD